MHKRKSAIHCSMSVGMHSFRYDDHLRLCTSHNIYTVREVLNNTGAVHKRKSAIHCSMSVGMHSFCYDDHLRLCASHNAGCSK